MAELLGEKEPDSSEAEFLEPGTTQDVGIRSPECTINSILLVLNYIHTLTSTHQSGTKFLDIYSETATQKDQAIQADMFLAISSTKQSSPVPTPKVTISFGDDDTT